MTRGQQGTVPFDSRSVAEDGGDDLRLRLLLLLLGLAAGEFVLTDRIGFGRDSARSG